MAVHKFTALSRDEIDAAARDRFGRPNSKLSRPHDLRFGNRGSVSVNRDTGGWYDHEKCEGGRLQLPPSIGVADDIEGADCRRV